MQNINPIEACYRRLCAGGRPPLKLFSGNPNEQGFLFPAEVLKRAYDRYFDAQSYQPHPKGLPAARRAIQDYYRGRDFPVDAEHILLTSGTSESFFYLFTLLADAGDNILVPNPAYPLFEHIARFARVELRSYPLREDLNWSVDLEALKSLADARTRALLLISPHNPTGSVMDAGTLDELLAWCEQRGLPLICDEVFSEFYFGEGAYPRAAALGQEGLCFTLGGLSKMFALPALKLGWIAVSGKRPMVEKTVDRLELITDTFLSCHTPVQTALPDIFQQGGAFLKSYREEVGRRRDLAVRLLAQIPGLQFVHPEGGFYMTVRVLKEKGLTEEAWVLGLMEKKGVFVHPGYFFDYEKGIHFIISFLTEPEPLRSGIERIADFL